MSLLFAAWPLTVLAATATVDKITVTITADEQPPDRVAKRMTASITTVSEQMLGGRTVADIETNRANYEKLIREIFDRVLVGYTVEDVSITPGITTGITVTVAPWGEIIRDISLDIDTTGLSPDTMKLINQDMGRIEDQVANVLVGLPVDSVAWAGGVSKAVIRELLESQLPEFRSNLDITAGVHTNIKLSLIPTGPVIDNVQVALRSRTIPNILLTEVSPSVREAAGGLRGLPVAFVERHKDYFTSAVLAAAAKQPIVAKYGLVLTPAINPGVDTTITLNAETTKYRVSLEGNLDMGRQEDNTSAKLHIGQWTGKRDEAYFELRFIPDNWSWKFEPGWGHKFTANTMGGLRYNVTDQESVIWLTHYAGDDWLFRFEHVPKTDYNEFGVRYKLHDFLSAEYIFTKKENWLRLVANL